MRVRVTAPYVTIKTVAGTDGTAVRGFYDGAIVDADEAAVEHLLRKGMVEKVKAEKVKDPQADPTKESSVKDILAAVGEDPEAAKAALEAEQAKVKPRPSLVSGLEAVIAAAGDGDPDPDPGTDAGDGDGDPDAGAGDGK